MIPQDLHALVRCVARASRAARGAVHVYGIHRHFEDTPRAPTPAGVATSNICLSKISDANALQMITKRLDVPFGAPRQ